MKQPERLLNGRKHVRNGGFDQISHYLRGLSRVGGARGAEVSRERQAVRLSDQSFANRLGVAPSP